MEDSGTGDSISADTAGKGTAGNDDAGQERRRPQGLARYAKPVLIAGAVIAVVSVALLVIIFFLDSFNATVYSVGGKNVQDATDEARAIRETYTAARLGGIIFLIAGILLAAAGAVLMYRHRNDEGQDTDEDDGEDVDFDDLAGQ
jgi:ABC-type Fe3+ transport system permease subunit